MLLWQVIFESLKRAIPITLNRGMTMENNVLVVDQDVDLPIVAQPHMRLIEMALEKGSDLTVIEKMMDLQDRFEAGQALKEFNQAMSEFQSSLPVIEKLGVVDYSSDKGRTFYTYAKLEDIAKAIQPALRATGLSYRFTQTQDVAIITVNCIITHKAGHSETSSLTSGKDTSGGKDALKGIASTLSYLRRYTLTGALGIVVGGEDTDGNHVEIDTPNNESNECYPDVEFSKNFPKWRKAIQDGKKTPETMLAFLQDKGIKISQSQFESLQQVEVK